MALSFQAEILFLRHFTKLGCIYSVNQFSVLFPTVIWHRPDLVTKKLFFVCVYHFIFNPVHIQYLNTPIWYSFHNFLYLISTVIDFELCACPNIVVLNLQDVKQLWNAKHVFTYFFKMKRNEYKPIKSVKALQVTLMKFTGHSRLLVCTYFNIIWRTWMRIHYFIKLLCRLGKNRVMNGMSKHLHCFQRTKVCKESVS